MAVLTTFPTNPSIKLFAIFGAISRSSFQTASFRSRHRNSFSAHQITLLYTTLSDVTIILAYCFSFVNTFLLKMCYNLPPPLFQPPVFSLLPFPKNLF